MKVLFILETDRGRYEEEYDLDAVPRIGELVRTSRVLAIRVRDVTWTPEEKTKARILCIHPTV
jgi:hypothetical protein